MINKSWRSVASNKNIYLYINKSEEDRKGNNKFFPMDGDFCLCVGHSGDCFHDYIALKKLGNGKYKMYGKYGAYGSGNKICEIDNRTYHLLQAGEEVEIEELDKQLNERE